MVTVKPATPVKVTLPNGTIVTATIKDGKTVMSGGGKPPEGAVVHTAGGDYRMSGGNGVPYSKPNNKLETQPDFVAGVISQLGMTLTEIGKIKIPEKLKEQIKPTNIGRGTFNAIVKEDTEKALSDLNKLSKGLSATNGVVLGAEIAVDMNENKYSPDTTIIADTTIAGGGAAASGIGGLFAFSAGAGPVGIAVTGAIVGIGYSFGTTQIEDDLKKAIEYWDPKTPPYIRNK